MEAQLLSSMLHTSTPTNVLRFLVSIDTGLEWVKTAVALKALAQGMLTALSVVSHWNVFWFHWLEISVLYNPVSPPLYQHVDVNLELLRIGGTNDNHRHREAWESDDCEFWGYTQLSPTRI